ncbi:Rab GTPase binding, partial [Desmophyllum pertusum]
MGASANVNEELSPEKLVEKQRIVIEELKAKMGLNLDGLEKLSNDDVRKNVDNAIGELMHPVKTKEELVKQLTTQIADLERFVTFLQGEVENAEERTERAKSCPCPVHAKRGRKMQKDRLRGKGGSRRSMEYSSADSMNELDYPCDYSLQEDQSGSDDGNGCCLHVPPIPESPEQIRSKKIRDASVAIIKRALAILQLFAISQFGCSGKQIQDQIIRKATSYCRTRILVRKSLLITSSTSEHLALLQQSVLKIIDIKSREPPSEGEESGPNSPQSPTAVAKTDTGPHQFPCRLLILLCQKAVIGLITPRDAELVNIVEKRFSDGVEGSPSAWISQ